MKVMKRFSRTACFVIIRLKVKAGGIGEKMNINGSMLKLLLGDITEQETEAIVNAANSGLLGGGGVDGAIHRIGGPRILEECKKIRNERGKLPVGHAVITGGGSLPAKYVIHTVGPVWRGGILNEDYLLENAYKSCLRLAGDYNIKSISFPSISTGAYRFPIDRAAVIALRAVKEHLEENFFNEVRFVLFKQKDLVTYENVLKNGAL